MKNRRNFIKTSVLVAGGVVLSTPLLSANSTKKYKFSDIIYTEKNQGIWEGKAKSHVPEISIDGRKVTMLTKHGMSAQHYIVRHTLISENGQFLGAKTFYPEDEKAESVHILPKDFKGKVFATSFCNKHDFWLTSFNI